MKKSLIVVVLLLFSFLSVLQAQNQTVRELGIKTHDFNRYQLTYKWGNAQSMWRFSIDPTIFHKTINEETKDSMRIVNIDGSSSGYLRTMDIEETNTIYESSVSIGKEFIHPLSDKCTVRYGVDLVGFYSKKENSSQLIKNSNTHKVVGGIHPLAGMFYQIDNHLLFGVEISSSVNFHYIKTTTKYASYPSISSLDRFGTSENIEKGFFYNISANDLYLSLSYRF